MACYIKEELGRHCVLRIHCILILVPPSIDESNVVYTPKVIQNRTVIIECPVSGVPEPTVSWTINDSPLVPKDRIHLLERNRQLTIDQAQVADTATYMCVAENKAGELRKKFHLEVLGRGNISIKFHVHSTLSFIKIMFSRYGSHIVL